jgi:multiple sugar transport system ATP-binding protein
VLYDRPTNTFVAGFVGSPAMNLCTVPLGGNGSVLLGGVAVPLPESARSAAAANGWESVTVGLRPESLKLADDGIAAQVEVTEEIGADAFVFCAAELGGRPTRLVARVEAKHVPARGARVSLEPAAGDAHLFDPVDGTRIPS